MDMNLQAVRGSSKPKVVLFQYDQELGNAANGSLMGERGELVPFHDDWFSLESFCLSAIMGSLKVHLHSLRMGLDDVFILVPPFKSKLVRPCPLRLGDHSAGPALQGTYKALSSSMICQDNAMNPHGLLIAYAETTVKPAGARALVSRGSSHELQPWSQGKSVYGCPWLSHL